ncbi:hypothetical protein N8D56_00315 [Devosia sp. A8/3-2]|nr:hypothetical protein N8D56_00315 [Devosia sp. A8/3-2]
MGLIGSKAAAWIRPLLAARLPDMGGHGERIRSGMRRIGNRFANADDPDMQHCRLHRRQFIFGNAGGGAFDGDNGLVAVLILGQRRTDRPAGSGFKTDAGQIALQAGSLMQRRQERQHIDGQHRKSGAHLSCYCPVPKRHANLPQW